MAQISDLPVELVQQILRCNIPEGFESARLASRHLYEASHQLVPRHREFVSFFRTWSRRVPIATPPSFDEADLTTDHAFQEVDEDRKVASVAVQELLMHIARNPTVGRYVEHLDLREPAGYDERPEFLTWNYEDREFVKQHVARTDILQSISFDVWIANMDCCDYTMVLLLTLVPRIRSLSPQQCWSDDLPVDGQLFEILQKLITNANERSPGEELVPLSTLKEIRPSLDFGYDCKASLLDIEPFLALNTVTTCFGSSFVALEDGYTGIPFTRNFETVGASLTSLELYQCTIGPSEIERLLMDMNHLIRLVINLTTKWHGCGFDFNAGGFVGAISRTPCTETLRCLQLTASPNWNECFTGVDETLKSFSNLEDLLIEEQWFEGPPYHLHKDFDDLNQSYGDGGMLQATPRLDRLLPTSIKSFELICGNHPWTPEILTQLFEGLTNELMKTSSPHLKTVRLYIKENHSIPVDRTLYPWLAIFQGCTAADADVLYPDDTQTMASSSYRRYEEDFVAKFGVFSM